MTAADMKAFEQIIAAVGERATPEAERSMGEPLRRRLLGLLDTAKAGEVGISVEILCSNLDEYEVALTPAEHKTLTELAQRSGADASALEVLQLLDPGITPSP
jgi:hypothetical protein